MKRLVSLMLCAAMLTLTACGGQTAPGEQPQTQPTVPSEGTSAQNWEGAVNIELSDDGIKVNGQAASTDESAAVYVGAPIVYYEAGKDFTYGEGAEADAHSAEEAAAHTVVTITQPGTYILRGKLSAGQVAVDLGEEAEEDPEAVVTLVLDGVDITCTVAPAVIFYNVYECGDKDNPTRDVDTTAAGANVYLNGGTENHVDGSYVARIYKPESVVLSADGTEVEDAKKLHKYDAAFYSKMSMNVDGEHGGALVIDAENEGLDSEMHLTINGGTIHIMSGNDGINTNEDGISVTTINGGDLTIRVTGTTGEGDGIDSNGWLVLNGGTVTAFACADSADAGIDSDMGIHIGAGATVIATGHMLDRIESADQNYVVFQFSNSQNGEELLSLQNADGTSAMQVWPGNDYSVVLFSAPELVPGDYTLYHAGVQMGHSGAQNGMGGVMPGGFAPGNMERPEDFDPGSMERPEGMERPDGMQQPPELPEGMERPEGFRPGGMEPGEITVNDDGTVTLPDGTTVDPAQMGGGKGGFGGMGGRGDRGQGGMGAAASQTVFTVNGKENYFSSVGVLTAQ